MITGKVQSVNVEDFTTKTGKNMFKIQLNVDGKLFKTISNFKDFKFKTGDEVMFEVQDQYPDSIVVGTLKYATSTPKMTQKLDEFNMKRFVELEKRVLAIEDQLELMKLH